MKKKIYSKENQGNFVVTADERDRFFFLNLFFLSNGHKIIQVIQVIQQKS